MNVEAYKVSVRIALEDQITHGMAAMGADIPPLSAEGGRQGMVSRKSRLLSEAEDVIRPLESAVKLGHGHGRRKG